MTIPQRDLEAQVDEVLNQWPTAGMAVGAIQDGALTFFRAHGVADVAAHTPVDLDTVFRIGSITKTFTAIAVLQLCEQGRVDLDAPVSDYLRTFSLVPARSRFRPATLRHLLTHTAGVRAVRGPADLVRPALGWGAPVGGPTPSLAEYYAPGLRIDVEPGTRWAYSNHGFTAAGQVVEDVTGIPFDSYLREHVFDPLGMTHTDLVRSPRVSAHLATGYTPASAGLTAVEDLDVLTAGGGAAYSSTRDMARYVAALLGGGTNAHGSVLRPDTVSRLFAPHYRADPRLPGMGLAFMRGDVAGHRTVSHDGIWLGFACDMVLAPDAGIGVVALANTGRFAPGGAAVPVTGALLRALLHAPGDTVPVDVPQQPWVWTSLCGRYSFGPGPLTDPQPRLLLGAGVEVVVRRGHLTVRGLTPIPAVRRGLRLHPEHDDPYAFRLDLSALGAGTTRVVFSRGPDGQVDALHLGLTPMSFRKRPHAHRPWRWQRTPSSERQSGPAPSAAGLARKVRTAYRA